MKCNVDTVNLCLLTKLVCDESDSSHITDIEPAWVNSARMFIEIESRELFYHPQHIIFSSLRLVCAHTWVHVSLSIFTSVHFASPIHLTDILASRDMVCHQLSISISWVGCWRSFIF